MPSSLSKSGDINDLPANWADWENSVQRVVERISGKNGLAISDVYYEVWNEPDLFGGFKTSGSKNYLDLYLHSAIGASRAVNTLPFKFGGPATTGYYDNWMKGLLNFVTRNNLKLDFLSWHRYSKNLDDFEKDVAKARGIFTNEKFGVPETKPRAKAILFLNSLIGGTKLNVFGQGTWIRAMAKKLGSNVTRILVVNYDPKGMHEEVVPIKLANLSSRNFTFKRIDFLGASVSQEIATTSAEWATEQYFKPNSAAIFEIVLK